MVYSINRLSYVQQHVLSTTTNTFLQPRRFVTFFFVMREAFFFVMREAKCEQWFSLSRINVQLITYPPIVTLKLS